MRFGYFYNIHDPSKSRDYSELVEEMRQAAELCEQAGFDVFWLPEHHFSVWHRELTPNPIVLATDVAARTKRIRIGLSAAIVTFWHPLRAAEDIAVLDHLTGGRLEVGLGRGNYGLEALNLNPSADPNNQMANIKVFDETVKVIKLALSEDRFAFKGEYYTFPMPGFRADRAHTVSDPDYVDLKTNELVKLSVLPRPKQRPTPPLWQVVNSIESIQHAARLDMGIIMWRPPIASLKVRLKAYRDAVREAHKRDIPLGTRAAILRDVHVGKTDAEAERIGVPPIMEGLNFSNWRGPSIYLNPGEVLPPEQEAALKKELSYEFVRDRGSVFIGSPERVTDRMLELEAETGMEQIVIRGGWPGLSFDDEMSSVRLLGEKVIPHFRKRSARKPAAAE
ncbi:MAG: LLM class flavin-dependent oxidoreductase [Alphaproteobacteria bacterium]